MSWLKADTVKRSDLHLTDDQFEDLWNRYSRTKSTTENVTVPKDALFALLRDHSLFWGEAFPTQFSTQKKPRKRRRTK